MSEFNSLWKATPFELLQDPYNLKPNIIMFYSYLLDEFEYWSKKDKNGKYTPSQATLAKVFNTSDRSIRTYINTLENAGLLETIQQYDKASVFIVHHFEKLDRKKTSYQTGRKLPITPEENFQLSNLSNLTYHSNLSLKDKEDDREEVKEVVITSHDDVIPSLSDSVLDERDWILANLSKFKTHAEAKQAFDDLTRAA